MLQWIALSLVLTISPAFSNISDVVLEESLYGQFQNSIENTSKSKFLTYQGFTDFEQTVFVDALWDLAEEGSLNAIKVLQKDVPLHFDLAQKLRVAILRLKYKKATSLSEDLTQELLNNLRSPYPETKVIYLLAAYEDELMVAGAAEIVSLARTHDQFFDIVQVDDASKNLNDDEIGDLFHDAPDVTTYMNGEYVKSVKIFMFCRTNRLYPCLMVMKNIHGDAVRNEEGKLWSNPSLASSSRGLPSYVRNGNTPTGIHTIDSVMPVADSQLSFGKYRRMILNFVPKSSNEVLMKSLLPSSSHNSDWWKPATVARDIGRNLLRIHGTGKINIDKNTPYYPFMRTSGCIAQRENTYDGVTFKDQRNLLDSVMKAMDLATTYENETNIKGILYVVEIDEQSGPVTLDDLALRGIE
jgi:hypothetical protein